MEKALALEACGPEDIRAIPAGCKAVVIGSEFCSGLLPAPAQARALRQAFKGKIVLATTLLTQAALEKAIALVKIISTGGPAGVIANDLGLLEALRARKKSPPVNCGRILAHRVKIMPEAYAKDFLARYRIAGFEADDAAILKRLEPYGLPFSWHYPFRYATVTRFCPWENRWAEGCGRSCLGRARKLTSPRLPGPLWLRGCAYFVKGNAPRRGSARSVYTPPAAKNEI
ncbi:MAG: hypothetical protein NDI60_00030 [Elusimicrobiales bacterium]|nr:hypothetical protein [Elusimicrobiales bacterium]